MKTKAGLWVIGLLTLSISVAAQKHEDRKEEIKKEKREFINQHCGFSQSEADKFWKLDDELQSRIEDIRKTSRKELKAIKEKGIDNVSDVDLKKAMESRKNTEQKILVLRWEYNNRFIDAVGVKKTAKFYDGEHEFRKKLVGKLKGKHEEIDED